MSWLSLEPTGTLVRRNKATLPSDTLTATSLNWDDLRIVLAIAEHGTLSGAAVHLRISHPTLSRRLQLIERRLGTRLFERTPSSLRLTAAGEDMRQLALRLRDDIAALERRIGGRDTGPGGSIRLTAPDAVSEYLLPGILAELCREQEGLSIDLVVSNQVLSLAQRSADIALRITGSPAETLRGRRVGAVAMAIYAARNLPVPETLGTITGIPWVGFDAALACSGPGTWVAHNIPESDIRFRANTLLGAAQAVRSGIGCGLLPCFVGGSIPELIRIGAPLPALSVPLWLLVHPDMARLPRIRRACDALAAKLKQAAPLLTGAP
ncbi:MAG: LysR family transcriptional regulator [Betaproteobacteria bacterium]|nr:LysR family transcriptional regulator [Betaproteobacteria bacterium]